MKDDGSEPDAVLKALADPHRRVLLDALLAEDGQTLSALERRLPTMTRFGCMKHLRVLEAAGLVVSRKVGRERLHYLNPVPVQRVYDRWVGKYARPWTRALSDLKTVLEDETMADRPAHVYEIVIRATPERVWQALTDGELTRQYFFGSRAESEWRAGSTYRMLGGDGSVMLEGDVLEADPPRRLVTTFKPRWADPSAVPTPSRVTYEITPMGAATKLTLVHDDLVAPDALQNEIKSGWAQVLSGLKTLLETGEPLLVG